MTGELDNRLIAAHLSTALITALPNEELTAVHAVKIFHKVLAELNGEPAKEAAPTRGFYESSNGDVWSLSKDFVTGATVVRHQPNPGSGGQVSYIDVEKFLREAPTGPQHDALRFLLNACDRG